MFLERKTSDEEIDMGLCYSILHKCVRRCLINESLYYGKLIFQDGTPNALRKRLIIYCLEDMARLDLAIDIFNADENKLLFYIQIVAKNKKTRITDWFRIICREYHKKSKCCNDNIELTKGIGIQDFESKKDYKSIRKFLGKDLSKLYTFMDKVSYLWILKILWEKREELRYSLNKNINPKLRPIKFEKIPKFALDKHVLNGTPGLKFFFENGAVIENRIYQEDPYEKEAKKIAYLNENK
tara:strand:- start:100 stop:819 length:720 start_codon:yes stop_codon:yes gene_type:complete